MAKYLGIPLTVSNGNKVPLTAQPELVTNGDFTTNTGWGFNPSNGTVSISGGELTFLNAVNNSFASSLSGGVVDIGKAYVVEIDITSLTGNAPKIRVVVGGDSNTYSDYYTQAGVYTHTFQPTVTPVGGAQGKIQIYFYSDSTGSALINSISVKEIAATETPTYGSPELIKNGDFATNSDWVTENTSGWVISGNGKAERSGATINTDFRQNIPVEAGKTYKFSYTREYISGDGQTNLYLKLDGVNPTSAIGSIVSTAVGELVVTGTFTVSFTGDLNFRLFGINDFTGSINNVSVKEVPYVMGTREFVKNGDFSDGTNGWDATTEAELSISSGRLRVTSKTANYAYGYQYIPVEAGKTYRFTGDVHYVSGAVGWLIVDGFDENNVYHEYGKVSVNSSTTTNSLDITFVAKTNVFTVKGQVYNNPSGLAVEIDNISVKELEYNYLQVADGGFTKSVKEGDVVFNTSTGTEGVVKEVIDNNVLLMSNDNFSTADEFFNVFAANGDTRGNQLIKTDNYIMSEYDENTSNPQESSFWFAGGKNSDKVVLTQLNPATNTFFVAGVIEEYLERLNSQSATDSRLDIPLDAFRDNQYNEILTTTAITLS